MRCEEVMKRDAEYVGPGDNCQQVARRMRELEIGFMPVCDNARRPIGAVTDRDLAIRVCAEDRRASSVAVNEVMTAEVVSCSPRDDLERAEELMASEKKSRIMVVSDDGMLVGVISLSDIALAEEGGRAAETLREVSERESLF